MLKWLTHKIFTSKNTREVKRLAQQVERIKSFEPDIKTLSDNQLAAKTQEFKERLQQGQTLDDILEEAYTVVKEACRRLVGKTWNVCGIETKWDMVPFDVQLMGAIALHKGKIAEMATGEGKTLVAVMPLYLNALEGKGVHLVTVNDYLARRDREWMGPVFEFLGLTCGCIQAQMEPSQRKTQYDCDITYGTNNEFGFDYLRDNMAVRAEDRVQRGHRFAIVDEVDSVLIDEARTPLIISGPVDVSTHKYFELKPPVERIVKKQTVLVNEIIASAEELLKQGKDYEAGIKLLQAKRGSPKNKHLMKILQDKKIVDLVDKVELDFIRDKKIHTLDDDMYFSIDEKGHSADLSENGRLEVSPQDPNMFVLSDIHEEIAVLESDSSLTSEQKIEKARRLEQISLVKGERIHNISQLLKAYTLFEKDVEYVVQEGKVLIVDEFTGRLMPGRRYSDGLHEAIEAKESVTIERETQTLATVTLQNYFRMYDKIAGMTGTAETEAQEFWEIYKLDVVVIPTNEPMIRKDYDDVIYRTKREKYNAIIDEIAFFYDIKRPVLVGTVSVDVSEVLSRMLKRRGIPHSVLNAKYHEQEAHIVARAGQCGSITIATNMAGRGTDIKLDPNLPEVVSKSLIEQIKRDGDSANICTRIWTDVEYELFERAMDNTLLDQANVRVSKAHKKYPLLVRFRCTDNKKEERSVDFNLGLAIIGTERHEARRIDRQLRGRAGRQGDPGSSRFYLSLEDDLMRLFGSDRISTLMSRMGMGEGQEIAHGIVTRSIEVAQKRVETQNFEIRKRLLEYDNIMNRQREIIYKERRFALENPDIKSHILEMIDEKIEQMVLQYLGDEKGAGGDIEEFVKILKSSFPVSISVDTLQDKNNEDIFQYIVSSVHSAYEEKERFVGSDVMRFIEKMSMLTSIDTKWREHLYAMDGLRESVSLRAYGQRDPLIEYKHEAHSMFTELLDRIKSEIIDRTFRAFVVSEKMQPAIPVGQVLHPSVSPFGSRQQALPSSEEQQPAFYKRQTPKVGRNDPCPCGSGRKYKKCCGVG
jgi:preprotein translocase subunit SecA